MMFLDIKSYKNNNYHIKPYDCDNYDGYDSIILDFILELTDHSDFLLLGETHSDFDTGFVFYSTVTDKIYIIFSNNIIKAIQDNKTIIMYAEEVTEEDLEILELEYGITLN